MGVPSVGFVVVPTLLFALSVAQTSDHRNAATWYRKAFAEVDRLSTADWELIDTYRKNPSGAPTPELRRVLDRAGRSVRYAQRGSTRKYSDYDLDYDQGFDLLMPHVVTSRQVAKVLHASALVKLHDGNVPGAMDHIATTYRMAEHVGHDHIVLSSLVAQSVWDMGDRALQAALDQGVVGPGEAFTVLSAAVDIPSTDPFSYVDALMMEQDLALVTLERNLLDDDGFSGLEGFLAEGQSLPPGAEEMTRPEIEADLDRYRDLMNEMTEVFVANDPEQGAEQLGNLEQALERGEYGLVANLVAPGLSRAFERKLDGERRLRERRETLRALAEGRIDAIEEANAAVWYLRAIDAFAKKDPEQVALLRRADADPASPFDEQLATFLDDSHDVLDVLRQAAELKRCDFTFAHGSKAVGPVVAPPYAPGLRDLLRLVHVDAVHRIRREDGEAAADRLRVAWAMLGHFQGDPMFATAIMTNDAFNRLSAFMQSEAESESQTLSAEHRQELGALAERMSRTDPFGYVAAVVKAREDLVRYFHRTVPRQTEERAALLERIEATAKGFGGDLLLYLGAVTTAMSRSSDEGDATLQERFAPLDDVYDLQTLEQARADTAKVAPALERRELVRLLAWTVPSIGSIEERMRQARRDLREGLRAVDASPTSPRTRPERSRGGRSGPG